MALQWKNDPEHFSQRAYSRAYVTVDKAGSWALAGLIAGMLVILLLGAAALMMPGIARAAGPVTLVKPNCAVFVTRVRHINTVSLQVKGKAVKTTAKLSGTYKPDGWLKNSKPFNLGRVKTPYTTANLGVLWVVRADINGVQCQPWDGLYR